MREFKDLKIAVAGTGYVQHEITGSNPAVLTLY